MNSESDPFKSITEKKFIIELFELPAYVQEIAGERTKGQSGSAECKLTFPLPLTIVQAKRV